MFGKSKKNKNDTAYEVFSAASGQVIKLSDVPDDVFANKILGDGYAVKPDFERVCSPVSGEIIDVQDSLHAYGIRSENGVEVLVHIGINSVSLGGRGFASNVKVGDKVNTGDLLASFDFKVLSENNIPTDIIVIITDMDKIDELKINYGEFDIDSKPVMTYKLKEK